MRIRLLLNLVICFFVLGAGVGKTIAHEVRPGIFTLDLKKDRDFQLSASVNLEALLAEIGAEHGDTDASPNAKSYDKLRLETPEQLAQKFRKFAPQWMRKIGLTFDGKPAQLSLKAVNIPQVGDVELARLSEVMMAGILPKGAQKLIWAHPLTLGSSILRINRPTGEPQSQWFSAGAKSEPISIFHEKPRTSWQKFIDYATVGFTHILPKGLDHILFVLGLFLLSQHWRPLLAQVTAFTIAHSVTLGLGLYGVVSLSPTIVEPLIALSIIYVAVENILTSKMHVWRPVVVFLFGLLHGLGFAGILSEIGLPAADYLLGLVSFNVGVELGQLSVIALAFLAVGWFMKKPWYRQRIVIPASLAIAAMGAWWFVERTVL